MTTPLCKSLHVEIQERTDFSLSSPRSIQDEKVQIAVMNRLNEQNGRGVSPYNPTTDEQKTLSFKYV